MVCAEQERLRWGKCGRHAGLPSTSVLMMGPGYSPDRAIPCIQCARHGYTPGCKGCVAMNIDACRKRVMDLTKEQPETKRRIDLAILAQDPTSLTTRRNH